MRFWSGHEILSLKKNEIFVFGSNPQARHGAGAASAANKFGAKRSIYKGLLLITKGIAKGLSGQTYAIITKNLTPNFIDDDGIRYEKGGNKGISISKEFIVKQIKDMYKFARENPEKDFIITYKLEKLPNNLYKRSLNGYSSIDMAMMFIEDNDYPENIIFHDSYKELLQNTNNLENKNMSNEQQKYLFFFRSDNPFSQWHPSLFTVNDVHFISCEQFMMYCKAKLFESHDIAEKILSFNNLVLIKKDKNGNIITSRDSVSKQFYDGSLLREDIIKNAGLRKEWDNIQHQIKKLGRLVSNFNETEWKQKDIKFVAKGNYEKFTQNEDLKQIIIAIDNETILVEASPFDKLSTKQILVQKIIRLRKDFQDNEIKP